MAGNSTLFRRVQLWVNEDTSRITATANAHFNAVSAQTLDKVEELYPQTTHALFDSALHVIEEKWGPALKDRFSMPSELISSPRTVLALLLVNISFYETPVTEIFYAFQETPDGMSSSKDSKNAMTKRFISLYSARICRSGLID